MHFDRICSIVCEVENSTAIRRIAIREINTSSHHDGQIEGNPETPWTITALSYRGL